MPLQNTFSVICEGKEYLLNERDVLIIPAGTLHILNAKQGRRLIFLLDYDTICKNPALTGLSAFLTAPIHVGSESDAALLNKLNNLMKDIYILYNDNFSGTTEISIYIKVLTMLSEIMINKLNRYKFNSTEQYADKFEMIIKYIEKNYMNDITLDSLVKISGYSKFYFSRMFSKYTGTNLPDFLNRRRIMAAEMLLLDRSKNIIDVAMQTGFTSLATFNRVFKKLKGCTPTEFRKLHSETRM